MARAIWSGSISFGLVNVPVKVYSAVHEHDLHFNQFGPKGERIRYKRVSEKTGREVDYDDIRKGYELDDGKFVLLDQEELAAFDPRSTRTIEIEDFVDLDEIDPVYFERTYYLVPATTDGGAAKAYSLLLEAMKRQRKVAIGKVVMRNKQYLAAIRPFNGMLGMSTMLFADEVVPPKEVGDVPDGKDAAEPREVKMASQIIDSLSTDWDPSRYRDTYTDRVMEYIENKAEGKDVVVPEQVEERPSVVDLMAALEASLAATKKGGTKELAKLVEKTVQESGGDESEDSEASEDKKPAAKSRETFPSKAKKATKKTTSSGGRRKSA